MQSPQAQSAMSQICCTSTVLRVMGQGVNEPLTAWEMMQDGGFKMEQIIETVGRDIVIVQLGITVFTSGLSFGCGIHA